LLAEIALVLRQVELTAHRADALPPADYAQKPTVAEWRERVTWLVFTLNRTREFLCIATARCATDSGQSGASESNPSRSTPAPNAGISTASPTTCASTDHGNVGAALDAQPPQAPQKEDIDLQLLAWAVVNCHTLARRALARSTSVYDREKWEHVLRVCERAGARSAGVLRASLPTEITDGSESQNDIGFCDLIADGGLPEARRVAPVEPLLAIAERIAREAHAGQKEESTGDDYIQHVARVVDLVASVDAKVVAWLHDVVEDNPAWSFERLEAEGIPPRLIRPVSLLTRRLPYAYADYINDIATAGDPLAVEIKVADLRDHLRPNCPPSRRARYEKALTRLREAQRIAAPPEGTLDLAALRTEIGTVLRQVELTAHRADALPPAHYSEKPTIADWRERVTWLVSVLKRTSDALEAEHLNPLRAAAGVHPPQDQAEEPPR
jgi:hypothetical protein